MSENQKAKNTTTDSGMFHDCEGTKNTYNMLQEKGYTRDDINLVMLYKTREKHISGDMKETAVAESVGIAGTVGGAAGVIAAMGTSLFLPVSVNTCNDLVSNAAIGISLALPGVGIVIAKPIAKGLEGAGARSITRAKQYKSGIKGGKNVVGVQLRNDKDARYLANNWHTINKAEEIHC